MVTGNLQALPPTVATFDALYSWYFDIGVTASVVVIGMLVLFMVKYRSKSPVFERVSHRPESWKIVLVTVAISLTLLGTVEYQTFASFSNITVPDPPSSIYVRVTGMQWQWNFTYSNGVSQLGNLTVPAGRVIILNITSIDVFHSFGLTMLDVKEDAIPGRVNQAWFEINQTGTYTDAIRCFELCGIGHATMIANLTVVSPAAWNRFIGGSS
jgi:cytochrome c oxidase subunit II